VSGVMPKIANLLKKITHNKYAHYYLLMRRLKKDLSAKEIILIHQMGKVGSTTIWASLGNAHVEQPILHTHILDPDCFTIKQRKINVFDYGQIYSHEIISAQIRQLLDQGEAFSRKWKIITLMRDPIAKNMSTFFEASASKIMSDDYVDKATQTSDLDGLIQKFVYEFGHKKYTSWFDLHLNKPFRIDIFASEFPKSKGYQILKFSHNVEVLVLKLEKLNDCFQQAFAEFLGIEDLELVNYNLTSQKKDSNTYKEFTKKIKFSRDFLEAVYDSEVVRHFYSEAEVAGFIQKWSSNDPTNSSTPLAAISNDSSHHWWG
jgi:hypothetical protein